MANIFQPSFGGGELKPTLRQRIDIARYGISCQNILNFFVHPAGGISNRAGYRYINRVKESANNVRLIPFEFNTEQAYALEFGDQYMRVLRNGGLILEANKTITAATNASPGVFTSNAHGFSDGEEVFLNSIVGLDELNGAFYLIDNATTNTFTLQTLSGVAIDTTDFDAYTSGGTVARVYEIETPYAHGDLALLKYVQSADVMTLTHPDYDPRELSRTGNASWSIDAVNFEPTVNPPAGLSGTASTGSGTEVYKYKITAVDEETLEESLPGTNTTAGAITGATAADPVVVTQTAHGLSNGDEVFIDGVLGMTELNGNRYTVAGQTTNTYELKDVDGSAFTAYTSGGTAALTHVEVLNDLPASASNENTLSWTESIDAFKYNIYKEDNGIYGYIGSSETLTFVDDNIQPEIDDTPPRARNPFTDPEKVPAAVNLYEQRRVFARKESVFTSQTSNYANMNVSSPAKADDAITFTLAGRFVNEIRHLIDLGTLIAMTSGAEWSISGADGQPLQPDTIKARRETAWGSSHVPPLVIGDTAIFNQARGKKVYDLKYTFESDGYDGNDISIFASHLLKKTRADDKRVKEWCYQQEPDSIVWTVHKDGSLTSMTYHARHQVIAWARHETDGLYKSVCCIPEDDVDRVYFVIERDINGEKVQYLEVMDDRDVEETDLEFAFFVDSGITIEGNGSEIIKGLDWLEGKTVAIWADGDEVEGQQVVDGEIELDKVYTTITIGLPYNCDMQPLDIEIQSKDLQSKGRLKKVNKVFLHVNNTRGIEVAPKDPNASDLAPDEKVEFTTFKQREWEDYGEPTKLKTGIIEVSVDSTWQQRAAPYFRHSTPAPITILGIVPQVEVA